MNTTAIQHQLLAGICLAALVAPAWSAQSEITAELKPKNLSLGESAQLIVSIKGSQAAAPKVPQVDGLEIVPVGQQSSMQVTNGAVTANVTHIYQVTPNRVGSFTIPAITAEGAGSTQPIAIRVDKGAGGQTQRPPAQRRPQLPAPNLGHDDTPVDAKNQSAFLRVVLPKKELTVGELVPVEVKAFFRAGVSASLNGLPLLSSDAFTLNKLSNKPEQTRETIDGVPYTVVTWTTALSAVKAGDYPLNLDLPVMVRVKEHGQRRGGGGRSPFKDLFGDDSPFSDSFFDDFFGGLTEKPLTLHTDGTIVKIKALPTQGRPADFSGAVGKFDITAGAAGTTCAAGDPLTLKIHISGEGNFDRVTTNGLPASADWKTYKPNARFEPADRSNTSGTKTFDQSIIPAKAGAQDIPAVSFSYFDPESGAYVTKATVPIAVDIAEAAPSAAKAALASPDNAPKANPDGLAPDKPVPARAASSLRPLVLTPWFIIVNAVMMAALFIAAVIRALRRRRANDPRRLQRDAAKRALNDWLSAMDIALDAEDTPRFFGAARRALQEQLAAQWHVPVSSVTIPEIRARLNGQGEEVRAVFQTADEISYSGKRFSAPDLRLWRDLVKNQLHNLASI